MLLVRAKSCAASHDMDYPCARTPSSDYLYKEFFVLLEVVVARILYAMMKVANGLNWLIFN